MELNLLVYTFLIPAAVRDLRTGKIPNVLVLIGYIEGIIASIYISGGSGLWRIPLRALWPVILLYFFFRIGGIGAGDVKLLSAVSVFLAWRKMLHVLFLAFLLSAVLCMLRMWKDGSLYSRLWNLRAYGLRCAGARSVERYRSIGGRKGRIPLGPFVLAGYIGMRLIENGGVKWIMRVF